MIQILAIQAAESATSENEIRAVRWYNPDDGNTNVATVAVMVAWIRDQKGVAYIYNGRQRAEVEVAPGPSPYIRTRSAEINAPGLLSLPRFE